MCDSDRTGVLYSIELYSPPYSAQAIFSRQAGTFCSDGYFFCEQLIHITFI